MSATTAESVAAAEIPSAAEQARILVVDDNEMNRDMLSRRLQRRGYETEVAVDGADALARLARAPFDLVLLDIMMPEMDGYEVLERLKADDALRHVPVIMISAVDDMDSVVRCIELGAEDHLPKPFNPTLLGARIGASLEKKRLRDRERLWAKSLERELEIGRRIQAGFMPETLPPVDGWELAARFHPARQVAGDFYDAFLLPDGRLALVIADVCGKGVGAALFMALFRTLLRAGGQALIPDDAGAGIARLIASVNDYIAGNHGSANMFATVFMGVLDAGRTELVYANCGHDAPVVTGPDGARAALGPTGPAVGMLAGMEFGTATAAIATGETLLAFTDGLTDARAGDGAAFSEARLLALLDDAPPSAAGLLDRLEAALHAHTGDAEPFDDVTLLALRRAP